MANELTLGAYTIKGIFDSNSTGSFVAGIYYAKDILGNPPFEGNPEYEEMPIAYAGIDGIGTKNLGFRGRDINLELISLGSTQTIAKGAINTLLATLTPGLRVSVTVPGSSARPSCKLKRDGCKELSWFTFGGMCAIKFSLAIRQLGLS